MKNEKLAFEAPHFGLIGHRGVAAHAPENTFASIRLAKEIGLNWVELDVRRAKGGELVIFHDATLERTTNGKGRLLNKNIQKLKDLDAGVWFSSAYQHEKIPSLSETLIYLVQTNMYANLEIKCPYNLPKDQIQAYAQSLWRHIQLYWPPTQTPPLVSSYNLDFINRYRLLAPDAPVGILTERINKKVIQLIKFGHFFSLHCNEKYLTTDLMKFLAQQNIKVMVYTVNDHSLGHRLLESGAYALFSDDPEIFIRHLK